MADLVGEFNIDYTKKDYLALVEQADSFLTSILPEWTDRDDNDINWATIKTICYLVSIGMFYIDLGVNEQDPYEVQIYRNALKLARKFGMPVRAITGGIGEVDLTIPTPGSTTTIDRGETCSTNDGKTYVITDDVVFPVGQATATANVRFGSFERYELGVSDGTEYQSFKIDRENVQASAFRIFIDEGSGELEWEKQDNLLMSYESDLHFRWYIDEDEKNVIVFGDNQSGKIPAGTSSIFVEVITIENAEVNNYGNLPASNIVNCSEGTVTNVSQTDAIVGGGPKETAMEIGRALPQWITTAARAIAVRDYIYLGKRVPGVQDIQASQSGVVASIYVIPVGGGVANAALKNAVYEYLYLRKLPNVTLNMLEPDVIGITVSVNIEVNENYYRNTIKSLATDALTDFIDQPENIGRKVTLKEAYGLLDDIEGMDSATITLMYRTGDTPAAADIDLLVSESTELDDLTVNATGGII